MPGARRAQIPSLNPVAANRCVYGSVVLSSSAHKPTRGLHQCHSSTQAILRCSARSFPERTPSMPARLMRRRTMALHAHARSTRASPSCAFLLCCSHAHIRTSHCCQPLDVHRPDRLPLQLQAVKVRTCTRIHRPNSRKNRAHASRRKNEERKKWWLTSLSLSCSQDLLKLG